jgi:heme a synthase
MSQRKVFVHRFAVLTAFCTWVLLLAGALVTSTGSGLAVPDWPLSYGTLFPEMIGGVIFEHGHRLIAGTVALLTVAQAFVLWRGEDRRWVRVLGFAAVGVVLTQALLGGLTVIFRLPVAVSVGHALLAQTFFCLVVTIAMVTSGAWAKPQLALPPDSALPAWSLLLSFAFFVQLLFGAVMRHSGAGLAIPDFPLSFGQVVPPVFTSPVAIHFAHRVGALTVVVLSAWLAYLVFARHGDRLGLVAHAGALIALVSFQGMLGAMVIWMKRPVPLTTLHLAVGALCLAASVTLTIRAFRLRRESPVFLGPALSRGMA